MNIGIQNSTEYGEFFLPINKLTNCASAPIKYWNWIPLITQAESLKKTESTWRGLDNEIHEVLVSPFPLSCLSGRLSLLRHRGVLLTTAHMPPDGIRITTDEDDWHQYDKALDPNWDILLNITHRTFKKILLGKRWLYSDTNNLQLFLVCR